MNVSVRITKAFKVALKPLLKRYPSLTADLLKLEQEMILNPRLGTPLGNDAYKVRLKITSKGKGKSGGARVISFVEVLLSSQAQTTPEETVVNLIAIYDKADTATITTQELKNRISRLQQEK